MEAIIIVGYGRMGKEIEQQATALGIPLWGIADSYKDLKELKAPQKAGCVAIEFTGGSAALQNLDYLLERDIPVVCGSTPWSEESHKAILELREQRRGYLMFSSNYSIGVNVFWRVVRQTAKLLNSFPQYDVGIYEQHHGQKVDSPSGTAMHTAEIVLREIERKTALLVGNPHNAAGKDRAIEAQELQLSSQRLGRIAGLHQLLCDSPEDSLAISHTAHGRSGFARGALSAAQFLHKQVERGNSGFFCMEDLMNYFLGEGE